jgi:putative ABC transport system ATP-binding protein
VRFGETTPIRDLSFQVERGERVVITGESGRGKSTLLKCLLGLTIPESGEILVDGTPLNGETVWSLRRLIAYLPQEPELGEGTLQQWLEHPFTFKANAHLKGNLSKIPELLNSLLLPSSLLDADVATLSGGEKQRAALIAALLLDREVLLLDEPSSALDDKSGLEVVSLLNSLENKTIIAVSHDEKILRMADRVIPLSPAGG